MKPETKKFVSYFGVLMFMTFLLFFVTVGLGKASAHLIVYMNDSKIHKNLWEWFAFAVGAPIATAIWCIIWLFFKMAEKRCIEILSR